MVELRELVLGDARALPTIYTAEAVRYLGRPPMEATEALFRARQALAPPVGLPYDHMLGITADGELVGIATLHQRSTDTAAVGYVLRPDVWGRGYATLAVRHLLDLARRHGVSQVQARHHPDNPASGRVLTKAGFAPTGEHAGFPTYTADLS